MGKLGPRGCNACLGSQPVRSSLPLQDAKETRAEPSDTLADAQENGPGPAPPRHLSPHGDCQPLVQPGKECQFPSPSPASALRQPVLWELSSPPSSSIGDLSRQGLGRDTPEGEDTILFAFCASKNSVMSSNSRTCTGFKVTAGMGAGARRFWEPQGGDDPASHSSGSQRFWDLGLCVDILQIL